jgi:hypothetical protein
MKGGISFNLFIFVNLMLFIFILSHVVICRYINNRGGFKSSQLFLIKFALVMNIPLIIGVCLIGLYEARFILHILYMSLFAVIVFNGFLYAYFHFFNMSETARRIRMLILIFEKEINTVDKVHENYSADQMVSARLDRLLQMQEISIDNKEVYHISSKYFIKLAYIFNWLRNIMKFD